MELKASPPETQWGFDKSAAQYFHEIHPLFVRQHIPQRRRTFLEPSSLSHHKKTLFFPKVFQARPFRAPPVFSWILSMFVLFRRYSAVISYCPFLTSTTSVVPWSISPAMIFLASSVSISRCTRRFKGLAPKAGS